MLCFHSVVTKVAFTATKKKSFARRFGMGLGDGQDFQPPRLMPEINRGGCFLLTEAVTINRLAKSIYGCSS
jgi:hypothetical protein